MSPNVHDIALWKPESASLRRWLTRERHTLCGLNLLLTAMFREFISGTQQPGLRKALGIVIPTSMHARVKSELRVTFLAG